jgi:Bacterial PH domain
VATYAVLLVLIVYVLAPDRSEVSAWGAWLLIALVGLFLARYVSTTYTIDDEHLRAWRILGGRRIRLEEVRRIDYARLRDLAPTGGGLFGLGAWGWRGRMWSPTVGDFDSIYTDAGQGLFVTAGDVPLYLSPSHPEAFARELSRRVRSYTGPLEHDVGALARAEVQ